MKILKILILSILFFIGNTLMAQIDIIGSWKTIDDSTEKPRSIVEIYKQGSEVYGKINRVLEESERGKQCIKCQGEDYNKPIEGLVIIKGLTKEADQYKNGTITDPENGKVYSCKIWIESDTPNILYVRGYFAFLYRTQKWIRM